MTPSFLVLGTVLEPLADRVSKDFLLEGGILVVGMNSECEGFAVSTGCPSGGLPWSVRYIDLELSGRQWS